MVQLLRLDMGAVRASLPPKHFRTLLRAQAQYKRRVAETLCRKIAKADRLVRCVRK